MSMRILLFKIREIWGYAPQSGRVAELLEFAASIKVPTVTEAEPGEIEEEGEE